MMCFANDDGCLVLAVRTKIRISPCALRKNILHKCCFHDIMSYWHYLLGFQLTQFTCIVGKGKIIHKHSWYVDGKVAGTKYIWRSLGSST